MTPTRATTLGLFVKYPQPGFVKTRLARSLGERRAAEIYEAFVIDLLDRFRSVADRRVVAFAPNEARAERYFDNLGRDDYLLWPQPNKSLGDRMRAFFSEFLRSERERCVLIGSDSPTLPVERVRRAFELLEERDCVLGPATDGGYYLIGFRGRGWPIFDGIDWSGRAVLQQTVDRIAQLPIRLGLLDPWYDVDTEQDLELLRGHLRALRAAGRSPAAPTTEERLGI